ncbi:MAG: DEAD/DEAH box helicase [Bacteroidota bacterium]|nr:DEAD/DEAH box helicase [Bacteroidota bacterium]MDP3146810.1 DEAD/DEAH box helicase [Bacteroidota bacterium]
MNFSNILSLFKIESLNEMQNATITAISKPNDVILISPTGSGKTLAFLLPLLELFDKETEGVQVLILVPTRELALQIEQVFKQMSTSFKVNTCYGGHDIKIEKNNLQHPPALLIGTPGRIAHHLRKQNLTTKNVHTLILDEFDKSLEAGFHEEMSFIIKNSTKIKKRILTSATPLKEIPSFVGLKKHETLNYTPSEQQTKNTLKIKSVRVLGDDKLEALMLLISKIGDKSTMVFCNHRDAVNRISEQLDYYKVGHGTYHGGLEQIDREKTLIKLRNGSTNLLITTDLAARGLDIPEIEAVIHYQLPTTEDAMIHRNGRTARMHASGTVYFLLDLEDYLPPFLEITPEEETLPSKFIAPKPSKWKTLYIAAGKKDKINKMDIVGALLQKGNLQKDEVGKIEVLDHSAYVAISADKIVNTVKLIREEKIKNKKIKVEIST